jgi:hypothetical protein
MRERLAAVAAQVSEPTFAVESVARRIKQRRARVLAVAGGAVLAVAALAVVAVAGLVSPGSSPVGPAHQSRPAVWLPIRVSAAGHTALVSGSGARPRFAIAAGRQVPITVQVTVPQGVRVRQLWFGIVTADTSALGPDGPTGWAAVLVRTTRPMTAGQRTFRLRWAAPGALRPGSTVYLMAYWAAGRSQAAPVIASLVVRRT